MVGPVPARDADGLGDSVAAAGFDGPAGVVGLAGAEVLAVPLGLWDALDADDPVDAGDAVDADPVVPGVTGSPLRGDDVAAVPSSAGATVRAPFPVGVGAGVDVAVGPGGSASAAQAVGTWIVAGITASARATNSAAARVDLMTWRRRGARQSAESPVRLMSLAIGSGIDDRHRQAKSRSLCSG